MIPILPQQSQHSQQAPKYKNLNALLEDDPVKHLHRLDRSVFTDEELFELEMKYIFEGNWVYLAHESQIPNINDFLTVHIGRQPVVITRSKDDKLNALDRYRLGLGRRPQRGDSGADRDRHAGRPGTAARAEFHGDRHPGGDRGDRGLPDPA